MARNATLIAPVSSSPYLPTVCSAGETSGATALRPGRAARAPRAHESVASSPGCALGHTSPTRSSATRPAMVLDRGRDRGAHVVRSSSVRGAASPDARVHGLCASAGVSDGRPPGRTTASRKPFSRPASNLSISRTQKLRSIPKRPSAWWAGPGRRFEDEQRRCGRPCADRRGRGGRCSARAATPTMQPSLRSRRASWPSRCSPRPAEAGFCSPCRSVSGPGVYDFFVQDPAPASPRRRCRVLSG